MLYLQSFVKEITFSDTQAYVCIIRNITPVIESEQRRLGDKHLELMTGMMSHEMLTPLNTAINLTKSLIHMSDEENFLRLLGLVKASCVTMHLLILDILDLL